MRLVTGADDGAVATAERVERRLAAESDGAAVTLLAQALERKDAETRAHSRRVHCYAVELARIVAPRFVGDLGVEYGFLLHDVGKIGIPDRILQKPGPLTAAERRVIEQHPVLGYELLRRVEFMCGEGLGVVRSHHERWDGAGYPDRLRGPAIPLAARIFAVADALDAMTSDRPYRPALSWADAAAEIDREAGGQFDPGVAAAFRAAEHRLRGVRDELLLAA